MRRLDALAPRQVGDRPRQLQHPVIRPRTQAHRPARSRTASSRCMAAPRSWRPVSSTWQKSRPCVGPMSALQVKVGAGFALPRKVVAPERNPPLQKTARLARPRRFHPRPNGRGRLPATLVAQFLERDARRLEGVLAELRQLVQEEHPPVSQADLARPGHGSCDDGFTRCHARATQLSGPASGQARRAPAPCVGRGSGAAGDS